MSHCPRCLKEFTCSMADNTGTDCWCSALPPTAFATLPGGKLDMDAKCFCPDCLPLWKAEQDALLSKLTPSVTGH